MGGIATNKITAIGSGSAEAEAVEAVLKPTASKTLVVGVTFVVGHFKSLQPRKPRFSSFENNTGLSDGRTDRRTNGRTRPLIEMRGRI